jgi:hypothetical protein
MSSVPRLWCCMTDWCDQFSRDVLLAREPVAWKYRRSTDAAKSGEGAAYCGRSTSTRIVRWRRQFRRHVVPHLLDPFRKSLRATRWPLCWRLR